MLSRARYCTLQFHTAAVLQYVRVHVQCWRARRPLKHVRGATYFLTLDLFSGEGARRDGAAAAKGLELGVDDVAVVVNVDLNPAAKIQPQQHRTYLEGYGTAEL